MPNVSTSFRRFKQVVIGGDPNHRHHWYCETPDHDGIPLIHCSCGATAKNIGNYEAFFADSQQAVMVSLRRPEVILPF